MSLAGDVIEVTGSCFPRVSGDEPKPKAPALTTGRFSPRERG